MKYHALHSPEKKQKHVFTLLSAAVVTGTYRIKVVIATSQSSVLGKISIQAYTLEPLYKMVHCKTTLDIR